MVRLWKRRRLTIAVSVGVLILFIVFLRYALPPDPVYPAVDTKELMSHDSQNMTAVVGTSYLRLEHEEETLGDAAMIRIKAVDYSDIGEDSEVGSLQRPEGVYVAWNNESGWIEWAFEVPASGEGDYVMEIDYYPLKGSFSSAIRGVQIDGAYPFVQAERLTMPRLWKDGKYPYERNELGHQVRPVVVELLEPQTIEVSDYSVSSSPLLWRLEAGNHRLRLVGQQEPVAIKEIRFRPSAEIIPYAEQVESSPTPAAEKWQTMIEAEQFAVKSRTAIQTSSYSEPYVSPDPKGRVVYNTLGGARWNQVGDWVEWTFEVPHDGEYAIDLKYLQVFKGDAKTFRTVMIDGEVPFRELMAYAFKPNRNFELHTLQDREGKPFLFRLAAGSHTIRLIADASPSMPASLVLREALAGMRLLDSDIRKVTGDYGLAVGAGNVDANRTWELLNYMPDVQERIDRLISTLEAVSAYLNGLNGRRTDPTTAIQVAVSTLKELAEDVDDIPNQLSEFSKMQSSLNNWLKEIESQPLMLDYLVVRNERAEPEHKKANFWNSIPYSVKNFARTFYLDYDNRKSNKGEALTVWVNRGRDYIDLMREMIDSQFTPETGIEVNLNIMPNQNALILSNAAGENPDLAIGVTMELPVDYAMRGAAADLSQFDGFEEVASRFHPGAMRSFEYKDGTYGIPDNQSFYLLFYRKDILERYGLEVPDTWEDVYRLLPTLQENGMSFFQMPKEFSMLFYQNGAEFFTPDGKDSSLNSDEALKAFTQWTDLFNKQYLPLEVPAFFEHFRQGTLPIGIADFTTYVQLTVAAPDITGHWGIAPLPGIVGPDGQVNRSSMQPLSSLLVMEKSKKKEEAWAFIEWWTSTEVQTTYGSDLESFHGLEYRWNSANLDALLALPWPREHLNAIETQFKWTKNIPYVPGHYFLPRELDFAWNKTVLDKMPAKEALEHAHLALQREMQRKQRMRGEETGGEQP